ncbi:mechanosensitive ion channel family protein [Desulfopila aestuarii]|uniref:Mechanosensitive ion channel n=1 Tax=Desulfopila aestuarii DSM 18488 TaxID=1121416 RepID=A0A1M7Y1X9_9BACT|nr:mechanosensitive ion channel domain-containing protein [Desulfopila aestuarii]SHO45833.1 Mechanosensitive ion channel [Desulfopila aestuarii DSM 18488]
MQQVFFFLTTSIFLLLHLLQPYSNVAKAEEPNLPTAAETSQEGSPAPPASSTQSDQKTLLSNEQKTSLINFYTWSAVLPKDFIDLQNKLRSNSLDNRASLHVQAITADIHDLQWEIVTARTAPYLQKMQIDRFQRKLNRFKTQVSDLQTLLAEIVAKLSAKRNEWLVNKEKLASFSEQEDLAPILAMDKNQDLGKIIEQALQLIESNLVPTLAAGADFANLQVKLESIKADLRSLDKQFLQSRSERTFPTLLSLDFYKQINLQLFVDVYANVKRFVTAHNTLIYQNLRFIVIGCLLFIILCCVIAISRHYVLASSRWYPFATCPFGTALFLSTAAYAIFIQKINVNFENQWNLIINILTVLAVMRLVSKSIDDEWKRIVFIRLSLYMIVIMILASLELPQILMLLFVFGASFAALIIYFTQLKAQCHSTFQRVLRNLWGVLPAIVVVASLAGYEQFAIFFFSTIISSIAICLVVWMMFHLISGLLELLLKLAPLDIIRANIPVIVKSIQPFLALMHLMLAIGLVSVIWDVYPSADIAMDKLSNMGFDLAGFHVSPGFILTIFLVLYGAILFSRAIQALLLSEVLPRYKAEKGVQLSITRLVHYAILTLGFLVLLKVLGFQLQQLTILGGALGVGIGFGLQAIVNNFVSGLILLFERPIKVGDTIQVGTELGEVKNLGLRATIIQTFDNSEIVVPNADLVTGQVTNWTLAERKVRVRIPIGVAYGTDVSKVLEILNSCAESHPMVLSTPKPAALFLAFGASSLDFELRFWIPEYLDKMTATSELNQTIESEFALNNIEIPFQQTDLHIRSVTEAAARALQGKLEKEVKIEESTSPAEPAVPDSPTENPEQTKVA